MRNLNPRSLGIALIAAMLLFALWTVTRRPVLGIADNGDYWRIIDSVGLAHDVPRRQYMKDFVRPTFAYVEPRWDRFMSSTALVAGAVRVLMRTTIPGPFDLRALGVAYWALLAAGVVAALRAGVPVLLLTLWVWILADPNYLLMFNSFYTEPLLFLSVAGVCALLASGAWRTRHGFIALGVLSLLGGTTKSPYVLLPLTVLLAIVCVHGMLPRRRLLALSAVACLAPALFFLMPVNAFRYLDRINRFNTVFFGVAVATTAPAQTLEQLGVPAAYHGLVGKNFFQIRNEIYTDELAAHLEAIPLWRVLTVYVTDAGAFAYATEKVTKAMSVSRLRYPGHFEWTPGAGRAEYAVAWQFSVPRDWLLGGRWWPIALVLLLAAAWIVTRFVRGGSADVLCVQVFLWITAVAQGVVAVIGDGFFGLERHLILGRFAADLLCAAVAADAVYAPFRKRLR